MSARGLPGQRVAAMGGRRQPVSTPWTGEASTALRTSSARARSELRQMGSEPGERHASRRSLRDIQGRPIAQQHRNRLGSVQGATAEADHDLARPIQGALSSQANQLDGRLAKNRKYRVGHIPCT